MDQKLIRFKKRNDNLNVLDSYLLLLGWLEVDKAAITYAAKDMSGPLP